MRAYAYLPSDIRNATRFFVDLNATVEHAALNNKDDVQLGFIINYLHTFFHTTTSARDLSKDQRISFINLLEEKIQAEKNKYCGPHHILAVSRILIRTPTSAVIRDYLANGLSKFSRKLNFEELYSSMYALKTAFNQDKTNGSTRLRQVELDVLSNLKEGGA